MNPFRFETKAFITFTLRILLIIAGEQWNNDIPNAIIPGLHCWYCVVSQAPYGVLWHIVSYPFSFLGTTGFIFGVTFADYFAATTIRSNVVQPIYLVSSSWIWLQAPYDIPILWFCLLGLISWPLTFLGPMAKLPVLAPARIWDWVLAQPHTINDYQYYALMGIVFIAVLFSSLNGFLNARKSGVQDRQPH